MLYLILALTSLFFMGLSALDSSTNWVMYWGFVLVTSAIRGRK